MLKSLKKSCKQWFKNIAVTFLILMKSIQHRHMLIKIAYILNAIHVFLKTSLKMLTFYQVHILYKNCVMLKVWIQIQLVGC